MARRVRVVVLKEAAPGEKRVPIVPESAKRLLAKKIDLSIEAGAGMRTNLGDEEYRSAGATVEASAEALFTSADVVMRIRVPSLGDVAKLREGSALVSPIFPLANLDLVRLLPREKSPRFPSTAFRAPPSPR